jgi:hypothetical protein
MMYQVSFWTCGSGEDARLCAAIPSVNSLNDGNETSEGSIALHSSRKSFNRRMQTTFFEDAALSEIDDVVSKAAETSNQVCTTADIELDTMQLRSLGFIVFADYLERQSLIPSHAL